MIVILQPLTTQWKKMQILFLNYHVWFPTLKKQIVGFLDYFLSFLKKYEEKIS